MQQRRIEILDSFRFLAIISVILFHYTYRWTPPLSPESLYPYGGYFGSYFRFGSVGVLFFFIISGFVISYTLENTAGLGSFIKNRFIRLFPPMLLWSTVTYLVCSTLDNKYFFPHSHEAKNLLPSLTFINPAIWSLWLKRDFVWLNGSYWSLWVEVQFYLLSAIIFFRNRKNFLRNLLLAAIVLCLCSYIPERALRNSLVLHLPKGLTSFLSQWIFIKDLFTITHYVCLFTLGVVFQHLYKGVKIKINSITGLSTFFIFFYQLLALENYQLRIIYLGMILLFLCMIYKRSYLFFLDNPLFRRIGVISYSVYLLHENVGILLINKYGGYLGKWSPLSMPIVIVLMIVSAEMSYRFYEVKVGRLLKKWLNKRKSPAIEAVLEKVVS